MDSINNNSANPYADLTVCFVLLVFSAISPILSIVILGFYASVRGSSRPVIITFCTIGLLYLGYINSSKLVESDLIVYVEQLRVINLYGWQYIFEDQVFYVTARKQEIFYFITVYLISILMGDDAKIFSFAITFLIYLTALVAHLRISRLFGLNNRLIVTTLLLTMFFSLTFVLTTQLIRQYLSMVIFLLGVSYLIEKRIVITAALFVCAVLSHNMIVFLVLLTCFATFLSSMHSRISFSLMFTSSVLIGLVTAFSAIALYVFFGSSRLYAFSNPIPIIFIIKDFIFSIAFFIFAHQQFKYRSQLKEPVALLLVLYLLWSSFLGFLYFFDLFLFQRFYYVQDIFTLVFVVVISTYISKRNALYYYILIVLFALSYFYFRIIHTAWTYELSELQYIFPLYSILRL